MDGTRYRVAGAVLTTMLVAACASTATQLDRVGGEAVTPVQLTLAAADSGNVDLDKFVNDVASRTNGSVQITVTYDWRKGEPNYEVDLAKDVAAGKADLGVAALRAFDGIDVDSFQALVAPLLVDSYALERKVLDSETARTMLAGLDDAGLHGIGYLMGPLRRPIGFTRPLRSPADYAGAKVGLRASEVGAAALAAWGAEPVVPLPGDNTGLDGMEGNLTTVREYLDRGVDSLTGNVVLWPRPDVLFANAAHYEKLTDAQRDVLSAAAATALDASDEDVQTTGEETYGILCNLGLSIVTATDADLAALHDAVAPVYADLERDPGTKAAIAAIRELRGSATTEVVAPCPADQASDAPATASPIDGVWTTSFTRDELAASPLLLDSGELNDQNWGDFRMELNQGKVRLTQHNDLDHYSTSGTFTVDGNDVTLRPTEGGNAGEVFTFRWSLFQDTLSFERHPSMPISPTPIILKPWTRSD
jgi:TRAP-type transport system periplasmic protein